MQKLMMFVFLAALAAMFLGLGTNALAQPLPCVVTMLDGRIFPSGVRIPVYAVSSRVASCPENPAVDFVGGEVLGVYNQLRYTADRLVPKTGEWERVGEQRIGSVVSGGDKRVEVFTLSLPDGRYRLTAVNGDAFLENVHFTVGGTGEDYLTMMLFPQRAPQEPYFHSARVTSGGYLLFRGCLENSFASGYLYQVGPAGKIELLPVDFEEAPQGTFANQSFLRGGTLDLPWVRVRLPNNSFDPSRPVYASVTRDGGGVTVQGVVFDPTDPAACYLGGFGGEYRVTSSR